MSRLRHDFITQPQEHDASAMSSAGSVAGVPSLAAFRNGTPHPAYTGLRYQVADDIVPSSSRGHKFSRPVIEASDTEGESEPHPRHHRRTSPHAKSSHHSRRTSSSTSTSLALTILSDKLSSETNRVTLLSSELEDQRRAYTLLLAKYTALQTTCSQLQIELDQYKVRFEAQQQEIIKAQTVVADVDRRRRDAEEDVVRGRQKLRQLKVGIAVQDAHQGGWKLGFEQGRREAGVVLNGLLKNGSSNRRVHEVLDEEAEERKRSRKSGSRGRRSTSRGADSSGRTTPYGSTPSRSETPTTDSRESRKGFRTNIVETITRRRSLSRLRGRSSSVPGRPLSTVLDGSEPPSSDVPAVPAVPPRVPLGSGAPQQFHSTTTSQQPDSSAVILPARSGSDTSTRISEYDLVSPPRSGRRPSDSDVSAGFAVPPARPPLPYHPQSTPFEHTSHQRRHTVDGRPQTSLGVRRPSTPQERTIPEQNSVTPKPIVHQTAGRNLAPSARPQTPLKSLFSLKRIPLYRNRSSGSVQIAVEPPSQPASTPSHTTTVQDPRLLSPDVTEAYLEVDDPPPDDTNTTPGLLDQLSRDQDTSYFPTISPPRRTMTPKNTYEAAPVPRGVVYPHATFRPSTPRRPSGGSSSSSTSTSSSSRTSAPLSSKNIQQHNDKAISPAPLNRPFSSSLFSSQT